MALRDVGPYHDWVEREHPTVAAQQRVRSFLAEVGSQPWRAPSVPIVELSEFPEYELRTALLKVVAGRPVDLWYRHYFVTGAVDIVAVADR